MDQFNKELGAKINRYRKALNMSTTVLSELSETSQGTISKIENGHSTTNIETLIKICNALGTTLYEILPERYQKSNIPKPDNERINIVMNRLASDDIDMIETLIINYIPLLRLIYELTPSQKKHLSNFLNSFMNNE